MPRARHAALVALLLAAALGGCSSDKEPAAPARPAPTAIAGLDAPAMRLVRVKFCDLVPAAGVTAALSAASTSAASWGNGDPVPGTAATDLAHELGCSWSAPGGNVARAWVFARPVSADFAANLLKAAGREHGCRTTAGAGFGTPSYTQVCNWPGTTRVRHAGLFGDTWLTCEVSSKAKPAPVRTRADTWCAAVATALDTAA